MRQFLVESLLLAGLGGAAGLLLAYWGVDLLVGLFPAAVANVAIPRMDQIHVDGAVLAFAFGLSMVTGIGFGLVPALHASRAAMGEALRESGRGTTESRHHRQFRSALVVGEVALALVLTTGAALMIRSFARLQGGEFGFDPEGVLTSRLLLPDFSNDARGTRGSAYGYASPEKKRALFAHVVARLREVPGVEAVGATTFLPLSGWSGSRSFGVEGRPASPADLPRAQVESINEDYFRSMRIRLLRGRSIERTDVETSPRVAVVSEVTARRVWSGQDPVGRRIDLRPPGAREDRPDWREVVGVVSDVRHEGLAVEPQPEVYVPYRQEPAGLVCWTVRAAAGHAVPPSAIQQAVWSFDKDQPVLATMPLAQLAADSITMRRVSTLLLGAFAAVAVFLAALGLYGVMAHVVARRTHEIGIRMAIGARADDVLRMIVGRGLALAALGALIGLGASLALTRLLASLLYGVSPTDPISFTSVAGLLLVVAAAASYLPARRAARVDPAVALRTE